MFASVLVGLPLLIASQSANDLTVFTFEILTGKRKTLYICRLRGDQAALGAILNYSSKRVVVDYVGSGGRAFVVYDLASKASYDVPTFAGWNTLAVSPGSPRDLVLLQRDDLYIVREVHRGGFGNVLSAAAEHQVRSLKSFPYVSAAQEAFNIMGPYLKELKRVPESGGRDWISLFGTRGGLSTGTVDPASKAVLVQLTPLDGVRRLLRMSSHGDSILISFEGGNVSQLRIHHDYSVAVTGDNVVHVFLGRVEVAKTDGQFIVDTI